MSTRSPSEQRLNSSSCLSCSWSHCLTFRLTFDFVLFSFVVNFATSPTSSPLVLLALFFHLATCRDIFFAFCSVLLFSARVELDTSSLASGVKAELMPPPCTVCAPQPLQTPIVWSKCIVLSAQVTSCIARNEFVCSLCVLVSS